MDKQNTNNEYADVFMFTFGLILKVLCEQWGWGPIRLNRLTSQIIEEYNENNLTPEELQKWCQTHIGFNLPISNNIK